MKQILSIAAMALLCASCFHVNTNFKGTINGKNSIKGEGPVITKSFDFKDFDAIRVNGQADLVFIQGEAFEVTLQTQENIFDYVDYRVEGTTLILELKDKQTARAEEYDVTVKAPVLKKLEVNGAGDVRIPGGMMSDDDFKVEVNGAGDLDFTRISCKDLIVRANGAADINAMGIDVQRVDIQVNGAGDVELSGKAGQADLNVNGAGDINATGLTVAGEVNKKASGIAKVRI